MNFYDYFSLICIRSIWFGIWHSCSNWVALATIETKSSKR